MLQPVTCISTIMHYHATACNMLQPVSRLFIYMPLLLVSSGHTDNQSSLSLINMVSGAIF